jgi:hypothetical protein
MCCKLQYLSVAFFSVLLIGCNSSSSQHTSTVTTEETIYIDHYKTHCTTGPNQLCLRSKGEGDDLWYSDIDWIHDFHYEWGHRYKVKVRKKKVISEPDPTGGWTDYFLLQVLEDNDVDVDTLFELADPELLKVEENLYQYGGEKLIACKPVDCLVIESLEDQQLAILIEVTYQESVDDPLVITQVLCTAPRGLAFDRDCPHEYEY